VQLRQEPVLIIVILDGLAKSVQLGFGKAGPDNPELQNQQ
jgi:hypothetical protein